MKVIQIIKIRCSDNSLVLLETIAWSRIICCGPGCFSALAFLKQNPEKDQNILTQNKEHLVLKGQEQINTFCATFPAADRFILCFTCLLLILAFGSCPQRRKQENQDTEH